MKFLAPWIGLAAAVAACSSGEIEPETPAGRGGGDAGSAGVAAGRRGTADATSGHGGSAGDASPAGGNGGARAGANAGAGAGAGGVMAEPTPDASVAVDGAPDEPPTDGNAWVAVGYGSRRILSRDGVTWGNAATSNGPFENVLQGVAFGDGVVVAVGQAGIFRSLDGKAWDHVSDAFTNSVLYHDGVFLAFVGGDVQRSVDAGKTWTRKSGTGDATHWRTAYGNGHFVAVGDKNGSIGVHKVSEDGVSWHGYTDQVGFRLNSVAFGNGRFVAIGQGGGGITSTDGVTWERTDSVGLGDFPVIAFGGGKFVACAGRCRSSVDGKSWSAPGPTPAPSTHTYGNGLWVGMGDQYFTSTDGLRWTAHGSGASGLDHVRFGRIDGL